ARDALFRDQRLERIDRSVERAVKRDGSLLAQFSLGGEIAVGQTIVEMPAVPARCAADYPVRLEHNDLRSRLRELARSSKAREAATDDRNVIVPVDGTFGAAGEAWCGIVPVGDVFHRRSRRLRARARPADRRCP